MAGIYLHIPFCKQACNYCDFYFTTNFSGKENLVSAIVKEIEQRHNYLSDKKINSIYFGGGTPSVLKVNELSLIFNGLQKYFSWDKDAEITFEANPDDINPEALKFWRSAGINRLSIGLQSFNNEELKWMNRAHTAEESLESVVMAQDSGFDNISIDLIYGSKFQTNETWLKTLHTAVDLKTQHISAYNLTIESKTVLGVYHSRGNEPAINDELSDEQFKVMISTLKNNGFVHYEISNFGKEGYFAKHNSNYWLQQPYLGLGPSAHSFNGESRQWNVKNNQLYVKALNNGGSYSEREELTIRDRYNEYVLTRLRTIWGCDTNEIRDLYGESFAEAFQKEVTVKQKYFIKEGAVYRLNEDGKSHADGIASDFFII